MKPFRFGVNVRSSGSRRDWVDKARKIEELGYDVLTVPDHLTDLFAPMPAVLSAAAATRHLRVGTNVLNNDLRHPVLVAREAATVDLLTDDRSRAAEELTSRWTQLTSDEILQSPYVLIGTVDQIVEGLQARRERWGF